MKECHTSGMSLWVGKRSKRSGKQNGLPLDQTKRQMLLMARMFSKKKEQKRDALGRFTALCVSSLLVEVLVVLLLLLPRKMNRFSNLYSTINSKQCTHLCTFVVLMAGFWRGEGDR